MSKLQKNKFSQSLENNDKFDSNSGLQNLRGRTPITNHNVQDQINFIIQNKTRTPKNIIEIGGGNGSITCTLTQMGYNVQCIDPMNGADTFFKETNLSWFNQTKINYKLINKPLHLSLDDIDWKDVDTIIMCEFLEHILEKDFIGFYKQMQENFKGYFIVVNFPHYHPLNTGTGAIPEEHCRLIDDIVYDNFIKDLNADVILRHGSHLVLNKKV